MTRHITRSGSLVHSLARREKATTVSSDYLAREHVAVVVLLLGDGRVDGPAVGRARHVRVRDLGVEVALPRDRSRLKKRQPRQRRHEPQRTDGGERRSRRMCPRGDALLRRPPWCSSHRMVCVCVCVCWQRAGGARSSSRAIPCRFVPSHVLSRVSSRVIS